MDNVTRQEFLAMVSHQDAIDDEIRAIRLDIEQVRVDTHEVVELFRTVSSGFKFLLLMGKIAASVSAVVGAYSVFKNGWFK